MSEVEVSQEAGVGGAVAQAVETESNEVQALREQLRRHERPLNLGLRTLVFLGSLGAFVWFMRDSGPLAIAIIVGVLAVHEAGHFVAMKALGYENMNVFFVPFLGAAVSGRARRPGGWRAGVVSLAGPVPGVLLAAALAPFVATPLARVLVLVLVTINGLNLLPFVPLDGGRVMSTVLFSRHRRLELIGLLASGVGLLCVPDLLPGQPWIWAGALGGLLVNRVKQLDAAHRLRAEAIALEGPTSELPAQSILALDREARSVLNGTIVQKTAPTMAALHEAAAARPAAPGHALVLFLVWAASLGLAWNTWYGLKHPAPRWAEQVGPEQLWVADFPSAVKNEHHEHPSPGLSATDVSSATSPLGEFSVVTAIIDDTTLRLDGNDEDARGRMRNMVSESESGGGWKAKRAVETALLGRPALDVTFLTTEGLEIHSLYVADGHAMHVLSTVAATPENEATFRRSFRFPR